MIGIRHLLNLSWIFTGRTDAEAETPILWPPDVKNWLSGKDPNAGKDWRQEEKGMIEEEMVGWHHQLDGHEFEQALQVGNGQGSLCAAAHGVAKSWTWLSHWNELNWTETSVEWINEWMNEWPLNKKGNQDYENTQNLCYIIVSTMRHPH